MAGVNVESILAKAKAYTESSAFQKKVEEKTDKVMLMGGGTSTGASGAAINIYGASAAAGKFIEVLQSEIKNLGGTIDVGVEAGKPYKVGKNKYQVEVYFTGELGRESLAPHLYTGIDNIIALLNNGYSAKNRVYGVWNGERIPSMQSRDGLGFIASAVNNFKGNYGSEYGVTDITVNPIYNS